MSLRRATIVTLLLVIFGFLSVHFYYFDGVPSFKDSGEIFQTFVHAKNLYLLNPWDTSFLTNTLFNWDHTDGPMIYTHNPNLPRYFGYLLFCLGIDSLGWQNAILSLIATAGAVFFIYKLFENQTAALLVVLAFFALDFFGVLQWASHMYRTWHFILFFGCLYAVNNPTRRTFAFVISFFLFQFEFSFAVFTAVTCLAVVMIDAIFKVGRHSMGNLGYAIAGSVASVAVFILQLVTYYGWGGFLADLRYTYLIRNTGQIDFSTNLEVQAFYTDHHVVANPYSTPISFEKFYETVFQMLAYFYSPQITWLLKISLLIVAITFVLFVIRNLAGGRRARDSGGDSGTASLFIYSWAAAIGIVAMSIVNPGYTYNAYLANFFPMLVFPLIFSLAAAPVAIGLVGQALFKQMLADHRQPMASAVLVGIVAIAMLVPWTLSSIRSYRHEWPPLSNESPELLKQKYVGKTFITGTGYDYMIKIYTGVKPIPSKVIVTKDEWLKTMPSAEYYICQKQPALAIGCEKELRQMEDLGHKIVDQGHDYFIAERPGPPADGQ